MRMKSYTKLNLYGFISIGINAIIYLTFIIMNIFCPPKNNELFIVITVLLILIISIIGTIISIFSFRVIRQREINNMFIPKTDFFLTVASLIINLVIVVLTLPAVIIVITFMSS